MKEKSTIVNKIPSCCSIFDHYSAHSLLVGLTFCFQTPNNLILYVTSIE